MLKIYRDVAIVKFNRLRVKDRVMTEGNTEDAIDVTEVVESEVVDKGLVDKAYTKLTEIFSEHIGNAITDTGKYLLKEFYDNNIELARQNKPQKGESLNQLIKQLRGGSGNSPSKSWIYQSIGLVVQENDIKKELGEECFQTYGKLHHSHKVSLLPITDINEKKTLINKVDQEKLTVRALEDAKKELIEGKKGSDLLTLLENPEKVGNDKNSGLFKADALQKESKDKLVEIKSRASKKCKEFEEKRKKYRENIKKHDNYVTKYKDVIAEIEKVIKTQETSDGVES